MAKFVSNTNLETVWSVQPASGVESQWFKGFDEALEFYNRVWAEVWAAFEAGDTAVMQSVIESDGFGGCVQSVRIADHVLPRYPKEHPPGSLSGVYPVPGVRYGNLALVRA